MIAATFFLHRIEWRNVISNELMRLPAALLATALAAHAAVVQGVVLDFESGRALARTAVSLTPAQKDSGLQPQVLRTEPNGSFFFNAAPGVYLLTLQRDGFADYRYGATCGTCPGAPLYLKGDEKTDVDIRMRRLGAITGTIIDENQVGIPDIPVLVYNATRPLHLAGKATTDDRGFFRFGGLMPGSYIVRTASSKQNDGASYLSTFYPEGTDLRYVRPVTAELDRTWPNVDFPPVPGKLYRVQGQLLMPVPGFTSNIVLMSDSNRQEAKVDDQGNFAFDNVAPGNYEFFAEGRSQLGHFSAWQLFLVEHDSEVKVPMPMCPVLNVSILDEHYKRFPKNTIKVFMRRKDLDREGQEVPVKEGANDLAPGDWELRIVTGDEFYPKDVRVANVRGQKRSRETAEGWVITQIPITVQPQTVGVQMQIAISSRVASLSGRVMDKTNVPAPYAPLMLETLGLDPPDPPIFREARAGADGTFQFHGLPPGKYRVLSSFDLDWSDRTAVENSTPLELSVKEGDNLNQDVMLYHKP
jgi:hypothetical protein